MPLVWTNVDLDSTVHDLSESIVPNSSTHTKVTEGTVIQWIPFQSSIPGNEEADRQAKDGRKLPQDQHEITFEEAKTIMKERQRRIWLQQLPCYNRQDAYYFLSREDHCETEDRPLRTQTSHVHQAPHWSFCSLALQHISNDSRAPAAELFNLPEPLSTDLDC